MDSLSLLHGACTTGAINNVIGILSAEPQLAHKIFEDIDADSKYITGNALHAATSSGHTTIVKFLIENSKVDINALNLDGNAPIHLAAQYGYKDVLIALVDAGANI